MRISIMQPTYLPWLGYFELMYNCDIFVFLDDVQFVKKTWHHRNKLKSVNGELLLTVPILSKGKYKQYIKDVVIDNESPWMRKHLKTIIINYCKASFFNKYIQRLESIYSFNYQKLIDLNLAIIEFLKQEIGIDTKIICSSDLNVNGFKNDKIISICKSLKADILYNTWGAKEILDLELFDKNGIKLILQEYKHPVYRQLNGNFISHLSALDLLLNEGDKSLEIILSESSFQK